MTAYKLISADSHIVEPPDFYDNRIEPKFRSRAPRMERHRTRAGSTTPGTSTGPGLAPSDR
jgi:hypothetical protein